MQGLDMGVIQRPDDFQRSKYTIYAVEYAASLLGIEVRARNYWRQIVFSPRSSGKYIAHRINPNATASISAPTDKQVSRMTIALSQSEAIAAPAFNCTDFCDVGECLPEAAPVDTNAF
jgi:hypothetical protein